MSNDDKKLKRNVNAAALPDFESAAGEKCHVDDNKAGTQLCSRKGQRPDSKDDFYINQIMKLAEESKQQLKNSEIDANNVMEAFFNSCEKICKKARH